MLYQLGLSRILYGIEIWLSQFKPKTIFLMLVFLQGNRFGRSTTSRSTSPLSHTLIQSYMRLKRVSRNRNGPIYCFAVLFDLVMSSYTTYEPQGGPNFSVIKISAPVDDSAIQCNQYFELHIFVNTAGIIYKLLTKNKLHRKQQ